MGKPRPAWAAPSTGLGRKEPSYFTSKEKRPCKSLIPKRASAHTRGELPCPQDGSTPVTEKARPVQFPRPNSRPSSGPGSCCRLTWYGRRAWRSGRQPGQLRGCSPRRPTLPQQASGQLTLRFPAALAKLGQSLLDQCGGSLQELRMGNHLVAEGW